MGVGFAERSGSHASVEMHLLWSRVRERGGNKKSKHGHNTFRAQRSSWESPKQICVGECKEKKLSEIK